MSAVQNIEFKLEIIYRNKKWRRNTKKEKVVKVETNDWPGVVLLKFKVKKFSRDL